MSDFYDGDMQAEDADAAEESLRIITKAEAKKAYLDRMEAMSHIDRLRQYSRLTKAMRSDLFEWALIAGKSHALLERYFSQD